MKIAALVIVLAGFAIPALAIPKLAFTIPKPYNKVDKAAVALFDASARKYAAAQTISTTFLLKQQDGVHKYFFQVRRPEDFHLQNGDGSTNLLFAAHYGWNSNQKGFYWRDFLFNNWEFFMVYTSLNSEQWLSPLLCGVNQLNPNADKTKDATLPVHKATALLKPQKIRGISCVGFRARVWEDLPDSGRHSYVEQDIWLRADNQTLWAVRGFAEELDYQRDAIVYKKTPIQLDVLDTRFNIPLKDGAFVYRLPKGQHDWVKDTATPFWSSRLHLKEAAPRLMTYDGQDIYEPNEARTTPLLLWIGLPADEKEALPDVERLANQWGGPKCEVRAVLLGGQVQWLHNGGHRDDEKHNLNVKYDRDFNHSLVAKTLGLKKVPFLLVIDREGKVAALNPDEKKLGEILPKLMEKSEK